MLCWVLSHSLTQHSPSLYKGENVILGGPAAFLFGAAARKSMLLWLN
jgi:hypothetical protein